MPARKQWDDEEESSASSSASSSPVIAPVGLPRRGKFEDEEDDSDVLESWDAAEDSEAEREKAKKAAEAKAKADAAAAAASKKSKADRIAQHKAERAARVASLGYDSEEESETTKRNRMRAAEKEADLHHAEDLFGDIGVPAGRKEVTPGTAVVIDKADPNNTVDLSKLPVFNPVTKLQFEQLRQTLVPILAESAKRPHYTLFLTELAKQLAASLPSDQIKKVASSLTALSNEKMKEEKASEKTGKKSKAQKTKATLVAARPNVADVSTYDDDAYGDDDFM